jgi:hypothetical protein
MTQDQDNMLVVANHLIERTQHSKVEWQFTGKRDAAVGVQL